MAIPQVAIVGRPNVGKSSIFNWLAGRRLAIVDDQAGVTRDRMIHTLEHEDRLFDVVDTGGMGIEDVDNLTEDIERQIQLALDEADLIVFVVDALSGLVPLDQEVGSRLRGVNKPVLLVANKCDSHRHDAEAEEFQRLGFGEVIPCSTKARRHKELLLDAILQRLPERAQEDAAADPEMKIAIVGRRNVGKSTMVNTLAESERMIVSEVAGTTRDSVDVRFQLDGKSFLAIDTPGLRKRSSVKTDIDFYGLHRAQRSIRRADVVLLLFDVTEPISRVDKQLCAYIEQHYKPCIFVVNKWDLYHGKVDTEKWVQHLQANFATMWHVPIAFITATTGKNVKKLLNHAQMLFKQSRERIATGPLNSLVNAALARNRPPLYRGQTPKIYYATQVDVQPPTIVMVCNNPAAFSQAYRRYLLGVFRDQLSFGEVPIRILLQKRKSQPPPSSASGRHKDDAST